MTRQKNSSNISSNGKAFGVTLLELLSVIAIISLVAGVAFATYARTAKENRMNDAKDFLYSMLNAARQHESQTSTLITGARTAQDWELNWKQYLAPYLAAQNDGTPHLPILTAGQGEHQTTYFFSADVSGKLRLYSRNAATNDYLELSWDGELTKGLNPSDCIGNAECIGADQNPCTDHVCSSGTCQLIENSLPCDDNNSCTLGDICTQGVCLGAPMNCNDSNSCTDDSCSAGSCQHSNNTSSCDDGNICTTGDQCLSGLCSASGSLNCDDNNACTNDSCDMSSGCAHTLLPGAQCDENADCTGGKVCNLCQCVQPCSTDEECDDSDVCNGVEICQGGFCAAGIAPNCADTNTCTSDSCDPALGCVHTTLPNGTACNDGNSCTGGDRCVSGTCTPRIWSGNCNI